MPLFSAYDRNLIAFNNRLEKVGSVKINIAVVSWAEGSIAENFKRA